MNMIPWKRKTENGLSVLGELRHEVDRLFDSFTRDPWGSLTEFGMNKIWFPAVDIAENDQEITVRAEVPGVDPQSLDISVANNRLTLSGEKKETSEKKSKDYYHTETRYGSFSRLIELPTGVDTEHVTAEHSNGVITITLKKTQAAATKRIPVKAT